jgi:hypothetical protein
MATAQEGRVGRRNALAGEGDLKIAPPASGAPPGRAATDRMNNDIPVAAGLARGSDLKTAPSIRTCRYV